MSNQSQLILSIIFKKAIAEEKPRNEVVVIKAPSPKAPTQPKLLTYNATTNVTAPKQMKIQIEQYEDDQIEGNVEEFIVAEYEEEPEMIEVDEQYEECEESEESEEEYIAPKPRAKKKASVVTVMKLQKPNKSTVGSPVESKSLMKIKQENSLKALGASPKPRRNEFKQLICYICNLKFGSNLILMQHFKSDHKDKPLQYTCVYCPETVFTLYRSFTRHVMNHTNSHRFSCEICNKVIVAYLLSDICHNEAIIIF